MDLEWGRHIDFYFDLGLKYSDIIAVLAHRHNVTMSERHLKRILRKRGHARRKEFSDLAVLVEFVNNQLRASGQLHGYRWMYAKCREHGLRVRKEDVRLVLRELDYNGVSQRQSRRLRRRRYFARGPNFIWHIDSYDKLKPYGICINGCIDGFSRKMIWLNAYITSSDPKVIGGYYVEAIQQLRGCPRVMRGDFGTENVHVKRFQRFLVPVPEGGTLDSYLEGSSTANQRIEYWWGFLRRQCVDFWLELFGDLRDNGSFDGGFLDKSILQFCFMGIIQDELDDTSQVWNAHTIRPSTNPNVPSGQPNVMFSLPELYGAHDYLSAVQEGDLHQCKSRCVFRQAIPCDTDVYDLCHILINELNLSIPAEPYQALDLYLCLREKIVDLL